jgi:hypothetical protein
MNLSERFGLLSFLEEKIAASCITKKLVSITSETSKKNLEKMKTQTKSSNSVSKHK